MTGGSVYRCYDSAGTLLYVGCTVAPLPRLKGLANAKEWWPQVTAITMEHFASREEALEAEWNAIGLENPVHNLRRPAWTPSAEAVEARKSQALKLAKREAAS